MYVTLSFPSYFKSPNKLETLFIVRWISEVRKGTCKKNFNWNSDKKRLTRCLQTLYDAKLSLRRVSCEDVLQTSRFLEDYSVRVSQFDEGVNFLSTFLLEPYQCELDKLYFVSHNIMHNFNSSVQVSNEIQIFIQLSSSCDSSPHQTIH